MFSQCCGTKNVAWCWFIHSSSRNYHTHATTIQCITQDNSWRQMMLFSTKPVHTYTPFFVPLHYDNNIIMSYIFLLRTQKINVFSVENQQLSKIHIFKPAGGQNNDSHACFTYCHIFCLSISAKAFAYTQFIQLHFSNSLRI